MSPQKGEDVLQDRTAAGCGVSELLLRACHDLRTPLRSIRAHAELLLRDCDAQQTSDFEQRLGFIVDGAKRIELLADGLVNYSVALEIERGAFQAVPMGVLLRAVLTKLDSELRNAHAEVSYDHLPRTQGNPDSLMQVFENLLRNAIQHRGESSPLIQITAEKRTDDWLFAVRDNGPGVEPAYLETIFKPFESLHGKEGSGPGLGLTICRAIVERHGGRMWAESNAGAGCAFLFTLPAE
jgi:light-regulated signal transduction histidine kinase (bacteriophytochrome)